VSLLVAYLVSRFSLGPHLYSGIFLYLGLWSFFLHIHTAFHLGIEALPERFTVCHEAGLLARLPLSLSRGSAISEDGQTINLASRQPSRFYSLNIKTILHIDRNAYKESTGTAVTLQRLSPCSHQPMLLRLPKPKTVIKFQTIGWTRRRFVISRSDAMRTPSTTASTTVKVAICQICSTDDVRHNLEISKRIIRRAVGAGAKVSIFLSRGDRSRA